jgi:hypothetical protein
MIGKKIINHILFLLGVFVLFHPGFAEEKTVRSAWTSLPVAIDARQEDWNGAALTSEESVGADFAFRNDAGNLYVLFIIKDKNFLSTLEVTGMTIYFNTEGKKKKDNGIRFFHRLATPDEVLLALERQGQELSEEQKAEIKSKPNYRLYNCELIEKKKVSPVETPPGTELEPPTFKYERKGEIAVFEFRIPLSKENHPAGIGVAPGGAFKIGFEWGGLTKEMQAARIARTAAAAEKGVERETASEDHARGREAGGFSTGAPSSGMGRTVPKKYSLWLDVKLAQRQGPGPSTSSGINFSASMALFQGYNR